MRPGLAVAQLDVQHDSATMGYSSILQETLSLIYFLPRKKLT
jgi:hypothetical protein